MNERCPICHGVDARHVLELKQPVPVLANRLHDDVGSALAAATGNTRLVLCNRCGHVWNAAFDPALLTYDAGYENSLHFSAVFSSFADELARHLVDRFELHSRTLVEIGSGRGDFLRELCALGDNAGVGYDPSYGSTTSDDAAVGRGVTFVPSLFPADGTSLDADFVYARHVLEHLGDPRAVLAAVRSSIGARSAGIYMEVPDGGHLLRQPALWDLVYEHTGHFTASSLRHLLTSSGFRVDHVGTSFGSQFLFAEGGVSSGACDEAAAPDDELVGRAAAMQQRVSAAITAWDDVLSAAAARGKRILVWGAGSKGTTFLNIVPSAHSAVTAIVDLNPRKHGRYVPGSAHQVISPQAAADLAPDLVLVMNGLYQGEVEADLAGSGLRPLVVSVDPVPALPQRSR